MVNTYGIILINELNEILICHPTNNCWGNGYWSLPKGLADETDTNIYETAKRELYEETNIDLEKIDHSLIFVEPTTQKYKSGKKKLYAYWELVSKKDIVNLKCESMVDSNPPFPEVDSIIWVSLEKAIDLLHESASIIIKKDKDIVTLFTLVSNNNK